MDATLDKTTHIGLGYASHADAFQCGREAAQMAKSQLPDGNLDLVLVFGPGNIHFKDFIEGVRLVTGEETLVGVPARRVLSTEGTPLDACFVLIFHTPSMKFTVASEEVPTTNILMATTSLVSQFRQTRGNNFQNFAHRGLLLFDQYPADQKKFLAHNIGADSGLEAWMVGACAIDEETNPLICQNKAVRNGIVAIECLSEKPWGVASVGIGAFPNLTDVHQEAVKAATRDALVHLASDAPVFGLIFFDLSNDTEPKRIQNFLNGATAVAPNLPFIGVPMEHHFVRCESRSLTTEEESVVAIMVPA